MMQLMVRKEAKRIYTSAVREAIPRVAEKSLSDAFHIDFESANDESKNASFHFVKRVLTKMAHNGAIEEVFDCNIERWIQSAAFMDAFAKVS